MIFNLFFIPLMGILSLLCIYLYIDYKQTIKEHGEPNGRQW